MRGDYRTSADLEDISVVDLYDKIDKNDEYIISSALGQFH